MFSIVTFMNKTHVLKAHPRDPNFRVNYRVMYGSKRYIFYYPNCIPAFTRYLNTVHDVDIASQQVWYCSYLTYGVHTTVYVSNLLILNMTFERFYSIIMPHKAASFNTVKRAKITIICIVLFSVVFHIPHWFITGNIGRLCLTNLIFSDGGIGEFYYWFSEIIHFFLPFILLLTMNSVIIHALRQRSRLSLGQDHNDGQALKTKSTDKQIFTILLLVTFGFLILTTPAKALVFYMNIYKGTTAYYHAGLYLFYQVGEKTYYTNHGINFFLYVMSGQKFRNDLVNLFKCCRNTIYEDNFSDVNTISSSAMNSDG